MFSQGILVGIILVGRLGVPTGGYIGGVVLSLLERGGGCSSSFLDAQALLFASCRSVSS